MVKKKVFIIAEAGVNHNGDVSLAKRLVDIAVEAGADAVKFQTFIAEKLVTRKAVKAAYQIENTGNNDSQFSMIQKLELSFDHFAELNEYCQSKDMLFLSTPFDHESIRFLHSLGMPVFKIPSGEITNLPYLQKVGSLKKQVILSTGMCNLAEVETAITVLEKSGTVRENITLLHCNTEYPTPFEDVNLNAMVTLKNAFKLRTGYSDHTSGIEVPIAATALGAEVIEKHFTIDKGMEGPDHKASLNPAELKQMIASIRNIEEAMGDGIKRPTPSEAKNKAIARRSIHLAHDLQKGHILEIEDFVIKRPGDGISPMLLELVAGRKLSKDVSRDELLQWEFLL